LLPDQVEQGMSKRWYELIKVIKQERNRGE